MVQLVVGQLLNGIIVGTLYGIIALGVTLTFGITGIVNFALGAFMMIGAYVDLVFDRCVGIAYPFAVPLAVVAWPPSGWSPTRRCSASRATISINGLMVSIGLISVIESGALLSVDHHAQEHALRAARRRSDSVAFIVPRMKAVVFLLLLAVIRLT